MTLQEVAKVIRSKNAGPYLLTFDIIFADQASFERVRVKGRLSADAVAAAYNVSANEIIGFEFYAFANAVKFSIRRPLPSGAIGDMDIYGAQQHAPLLTIDVL